MEGRFYPMMTDNRTNWSKVIDEVKTSLVWFQRHGVPRPSLRTIFYRLVSLGIIPNTNQSYKSLSAATVKARKSGEIPWDCFSDHGRQVLGNFQENYRSPKQFIQQGIDFLKNAPQKYTIPRWYKQTQYVEVWIEKQALADTFISFLKYRQVKVAVNKGYASWSFLYDNCKRLKEVFGKTGKRINVLYFGDFDPSGEDMDRHMRQSFSTFGLNNTINFQRIAVTKEQIAKFKLPSIPDNQETLDKVNNDTRIDQFIEKHGKLYVVELDALLAIVPEEFKSLVQKSVDQFFNQTIYDDIRAEYTPEQIERLVQSKVKFLTGN
jgi:hypothetical protein